MDKIVYSYGDKFNIKPLIGMMFGGFMLITNSFYSGTFLMIGISVVVVNLLVLTISSKNKEVLVIEDRKLKKANVLFFITEYNLDDYENYEIGTYSRGGAILFATNKRTKFRTQLIKDHYNEPIESIKDTILEILDGTSQEITKVEANIIEDEYAYNPDDYII